MELDRSRFITRLAESEEDLRSAQRLRYRVFVEEMGAPAAGADHAGRLERDSFDPLFDHLILIDTHRVPADPLDRVVGVYRLLPGARAAHNGGFYGASEYDLTKIAALGARTVELGRSCIDANYRGGSGLYLMWQALADYVVARKIEILFGVASFSGTDVDAIAPALAYLHHNHLAPPELCPRALGDGYVDMNLMPQDQIDTRTALAQVPALIKAYLRVGGMIGDGAFIDHNFNTIDVCLLMDTTRMRDKYRNYYIRDRVAS